MDNLVRTANTMSILPKENSRIRSQEVHPISETIADTIPSFRRKFPRENKEAL